MPACLHAGSSVSAAADIRKRKRTGAMLSSEIDSKVILMGHEIVKLL
jgi:hypothetical protein